MIRKIGVIRRSYRHLQRYRAILAVLIKYGFADLLDRLRLEQHLKVGLERVLSREEGGKLESLSRAERMRMVIEELGPTFVKMGQMLSTRPDLLPVELIHELAKLQDSVPPFPFSEVEEIVESELGHSLEEIFEQFEETPLASASLGQVHRARLTSGEEVVVKVQRPHIVQTIEVDLEIALHLASLMETHNEGWEIQRPTRIIDEFSRSLGQELDYRIEAAHMARFAAQMSGDPTVYVPRVYRQATTARVLTMEHIRGTKASNLERLEEEGLDRKEIASRGADLIMKQIFVHGFFHADPHPGNILILPHNIICYLDFGIVGRLSRRSRENFADLVTSTVRRDPTEAASALLRLTYWDEEPDRHSLERDLADFEDQHFHGSLKDLDLGMLLRQLLRMAAKHRLQVPPDLFLMLKALVTVEGLGEVLDPDLDFVGKAAPFLRRLQMDRLHPHRVASEIAHTGWEFLELLKDLPIEVRELLRLTKAGRIRVEFEHRGLEPMLTAHERISNRLTFSIVLASLVVGSALVLHSGIPPKWHDMPVIGLAGFVVAALMGFALLASILKHGKM